MLKKLVVWDWNGTLLNDVDYCVSIMNNVLKKYKLNTINADYYRKIFTFPVEDYYKKLGFDFSKSSFKEVGLEFINEYNKQVDSCPLFDNTIEILKKLKEAKISQIIISAREQSSLFKDVKNHDVFEFFDSVVGISDNYASSKFYLFEDFFESYNNISRNEILLIGDTVHDCDIAKKLGIDFVHFSRGHQNTSHFKNCENIQSIVDLSELKEIILS